MYFIFKELNLIIKINYLNFLIINLNPLIIFFTFLLIIFDFLLVNLILIKAIFIMIIIIIKNYYFNRINLRLMKDEFYFFILVKILE